MRPIRRSGELTSACDAAVPDRHWHLRRESACRRERARQSWLLQYRPQEQLRGLPAQGGYGAPVGVPRTQPSRELVPEVRVYLPILKHVKQRVIGYVV